MPSTPRISALLCLVVLLPAAQADRIRVGVETGALWQTRNDVRIPGDDGTRFALDDVAGQGPFPFVRLDIDWQVAERHGLRLVYAPLRFEERGTLEAPVEFAGEDFAAGTVEATYQFNAPRVTYRYRLQDTERWRFDVGLTVLVRDAEVRLLQDGVRGRDTDLGFVPLLHLAGHYRLGERWRLVFDLDGLAAPQGRAFDLGLRAEYAVARHWDAFAGYRMLEGGVDNDDVFNSSWLNYAVFGAAYRF